MHKFGMHQTIHDAALISFTKNGTNIVTENPKTVQILLFYDYIQKRDQKSENFV